MTRVYLNLPASRVIRTLERIAAWRGYPAKVRLDNGPEFVALALAEWAERKGIVLNLIEPGRPIQNGFSERFNGSFRRGVPAGGRRRYSKRGDVDRRGRRLPGGLVRFSIS